MNARAFGIDGAGQSVNINPSWTATDPDMVTVLPSQGTPVQIVVHRPGQSRLRVEAAGIFRDLSISATYLDNVIQIQIFQ